MSRGFWRLSLSQILIVTSVLAVLSVVWMCLLQAPRRALALAERAARETETRNAALYECVLAKDAEAVARLLREGADTEIWHARLDSDDARERVLDAAIRLGDPACTQLILDKAPGVQLTQTRLPLEAVVRSDSPISNKLELLQLLIDHGAKANAEPGAMDVALEGGMTELVAYLRRAGAVFGPREMVIGGHVDELPAAIAADPQVLSSPMQTSYRGCRSLLGMALICGRAELANWLLDAGATLEMYEPHGQTAVHVAVLGDCGGILPRLQAHGCDVDQADKAGDTPLSDGVWIASPVTIAALIATGANVNKPSSRGHTPLHWAVQRYQKSDESDAKDAALSIISLLLRAGADPDAVDIDGKTPREIARAGPRVIDDLFE